MYENFYKHSTSSTWCISLFVRFSQIHLRVYHQIQERLCVHMSSVYWGLKVSARNLLSIMTDLQPAPQKFLETVRCGCKYACNTTRCSCRTHGMICSTACSECRGVCDNTPNDIDSESDEDACSVLE